LQLNYVLCNLLYVQNNFYFLISDEIFCTDGSREKIDNLKEFFTAGRCSPLLSKPKLFLIQACQGNEYQPGKKQL
jgi:hypothetical protein